MQATTDAMKLLAGFRMALQQMYVRTTTWVGRPTSGGRTAQFDIAAGVPQGCPLSGSILSACTRALIAQLELVIDPAHIFAFADDVAILVASVHDLAVIRRVFAVFE